MNLKKSIFLGLTMSTTLFVACESSEEEPDEQETIENVEAAVVEIENLHEFFVSEINSLFATETELQAAFDQTLAEDDDLTTLSDGSSPVFENIDNRSANLEAIETAETDLEAQLETIQDYDGEDLSTEELESIVQEFEPFLILVAEFRGEYQDSLTNQENYFTSLATDDATYDTFVEGTESINEEREALLEEWGMQLDQLLYNYDSSLHKLTELIDETNTAAETEETDE